MSSVISSGYHIGKILARRVASPTVVVLDIDVPKEVTFQPGQWIDFVVPPYSWIGGFSMANLPSDPFLTIAVKRSNHPPSQWVHSDESKELGREVHVKVGGQCVMTDEIVCSGQPVVFAAGGIGISPLLSMYRYWTEGQKQRENPQKIPTPSASFFYSVSREEELVFGNELVSLVQSNSNDGRTKINHRLVFTLTKQTEWKNIQDSEHIEYKKGRCMKEFLQEADTDSVFYLCGPPAMLDAGVEILKQRGIKKQSIHYERWW